MKHCILARFRADAGDWRAYLPEIREIFSAAGDIPGVRGAEVFHNCVDRENRYHVLIRLDMDPAALAAYDVSPMHHRWKDRFGPLLEKKAIFDFDEMRSLDYRHFDGAALSDYIRAYRPDYVLILRDDVSCLNRTGNGAIS